MRLGALLGVIPDPNNPNTLAEQARQYVGEGFESLWTPQAIGRGMMITDALTVLTVAASVTEDVELGSAVIQVPLYQPVELAHRVFSLMQLCGKRLILGVGVGSTEKDFDAFGRHYETRFADFASGMEILRELFKTGKYKDIDLSPWPPTLGGPPLFLGTWGKRVTQAAQAYDGWIASGHYRTPEEVAAALVEYRQAGGGRAIVSTIQITAKTDLGEFKEKLDKFAEAGFDDAVVMMLPGSPAPNEIRKLVR